MTLERRVMWVEGMFLRQQHFQQQDRWLEAVLRDRVGALTPFGWGLIDARPDAAALASGAFALTAARGVMPDGLSFSFPDRDPAPPAIEIDKGVVNQTVYLVAPEARPGQRLGSMRPAGGGAASTRYVIDEVAVGDAHDENTRTVDLQVGALNLRYEIGARERPGFVAMPVARIAERGADRTVTLAPDFIPPVLGADASPVLTEHVKEVAALLQARAEMLAGQYSQVGGRSGAAIQEFMILQIINARGVVFDEMRDVARHHPETLYREMLALAGELAAFTREETRRPPPFPRYDHDDLTATFAPVMEEIRRSLAWLGEQKAVRIPLQHRRKQNVFFGPIPDASLIEDARFVLIANAAMDSEEFRNAFPRQVSMGAVGEIASIVGAADRSIRIRPLAHPPQELPRMNGWLYLDVDKSTPAWGGVAKARDIAIHHAARFPELQIQLWAIRD